MANVSIKFNNKEFLLSCDEGQEEHLEELLIQINQKFNNLKNDLGNIGENKLLLITAVKVMDEYHETKKKVEQKQIELRDLSNKFRELKNLDLSNPDLQNNIKNLSLQKNQLEIEKQDLEDKYKLLIENYNNLSDKLKEIENKEKTEHIKQMEFSEKIDELNQETDTLLEEIDKWQT